jgi:hypothetical protein
VAEGFADHEQAEIEPRATISDGRFAVAPKERWPVFIGNWIHQSFLLPPVEAENALPPGKPVTAIKWALGELEIGDSVGPDIVDRPLRFEGGDELIVTLHLEAQEMGEPYKLTGKGIGLAGKTLGAEYQLTGWAMVSTSDDTVVVSVHGAIRLVKKSELEPAQVGTVGHFRLTPKPKRAG